MPPSPLPNRRRRNISFAAGALLAGLGASALADARRVMARMTDGPFYPPRAWREQWTDWDADLSRVQRRGETLIAQGEHLGLELQLVDVNNRVIDGAEVEIWQCDALAAYHHPQVRVTQIDTGFQGFGASRSDAEGWVRFRTIKPVAYPGRTPHIHVKLRHASFGEVTSQLFIAGDAGNARDFLWRALDPGERDALAMALQPAPADSGLRWSASHTLWVPG
jgi:protocatechuate 3,4-dioxygenase beta subunit